MDFVSPLRYPGGKAKVSPFVQELIIQNNLLDGTYVEPYVGGASVALTLLFNECVSDIYINDIDVSIYAFWYCVLKDSDRFCRLIHDTPINMEIWKKQRDVQSNKSQEDLLTIGFSTFFLNRTNRSGILNAGVIGGNDQTGNYKIDARYHKADLIRRIQRITEYSDRIHLFNMDAINFINGIAQDLSEKTLFYFDPPYYVKGKGLYLNYYNDTDHREIANAIKTLTRFKWIISYDNVEFITSLYSDFRQKIFELNYSASNSGKGKEVMIFSNNLIIPNHKLFNNE